MPTFRDEGVVLRTITLGEADRIITLLTPQHGKVRAVAKGVRKPKSKLAGSLQPMCHVSLLCWRGRELDIVTQVEAIDQFRSVREDLDRITVAFTMLETVDALAVERQPAHSLFRSLTGALHTLAGDGSPVLLGAFLLRVLDIEGVGPIVDSCAACGEDAQLVGFDEQAGGLLCRSCRSGRAVSPEAVELIRDILLGRLRRALAMPAGRATAEVEKLAVAAMEYHLDRRLRSAHPAPLTLQA